MKGASNLGIPKSSTEATGNCAETKQSLCRKEEFKIVGGTFTVTAKNPTRLEIRRYVKNIPQKPEFNMYTAKETLGCRGRKTYGAAARRAAKKEENQRRTRGETYPKQITKAP